MALSNAERQKRWRDQRNALAKQATATPAPLRNTAELWAKAKPHIKALEAEGRKRVTEFQATASPASIAMRAHYLRLLLDPDYPAVVEARKAKALRRVT